MMTSRIYLTLTSVSLLWGTSFAAAKICLTEMTPMNVVALRFLIASIIFGIILTCMRQNNRIHKEDLAKFIILGFVAITSYFYIQVTGLKYTTTIHSALIIATSPIFTMLFSMMLQWEKISSLSFIGILTAFTGVTLIITNGNYANIFLTQTLKGDVMLLSNAIVWAGFTLYGKSILQKYRPFVAMAYIHIFGTAMLLPFALFSNVFTEISLQQQLFSVSSSTWLAAIYLAVLCSVYAYFIWYRAVERIGAVRTSVFSYLNPLFAIIVGITFMNEKVTVFTFVGGVMVLLGVFLTNNTNLLRNRLRRSKNVNKQNSSN